MNSQLSVNSIAHSNETTAMTINSSGQITQSQLIAFHAHTITAQSVNNYVIFTTEITDTKSCYNVSNGTFTVPAGGDGVYIFHCRLLFDKDSGATPDTNYNIIQFRKNNSPVSYFISSYYVRGDYDYNIGFHVQAMAAGDTMRIYSGGNATLYAGNYSHFAGYRIG